MPIITNIFSRFTRALFIFVASVFVLLIIAVALIMTPPVQQIIADQTAAFISDKTNSKVSVGKLFINFRGEIVLQNFYAEDLQNDTLVYLGELNADIRLIDLLNRKVRLKKIEINHLISEVSRAENDDFFNFQFFIDAFDSDNQTHKSAERKDNTSSPWTFELENLVLNNISGNYDDRYEGYQANWDIGNFRLRIEKLDIANQVVAIDEITLDNNEIQFSQSKPPEIEINKSDTTALPAWMISVGKLNIIQTSFNVNNLYSRQYISIRVGDFSIEQIDSDLARRNLSFGNVQLSESFTAFETGADAPLDSLQIEGIATDTPAANDSWNIALKNLSVKDHELSYHDHRYPSESEDFDFNHIELKPMNLQLNEGESNSDNMGFHLVGLNFTDQNGFRLDHFSAVVGFTNDSLFVRDLLLQTKSSAVELNARAAYPLPEALFTTSNEVNYELDLAPSEIAYDELVYFAPSLAAYNQLIVLGNPRLQIEASLNGHSDQIKIGGLMVSTPGGSSALVSGKIEHLSQEPYFNLLLDQLVVYDEELNKLIPKNTLPGFIRLPKVTNASGFLDGTARKFNAGVSLALDSDKAHFEGSYYSPEQESPQYALNGSFVTQRAGYYFSNDEFISDFSGDFELSGKGVEPGEIEADIQLNVSEVMLSDYCYNDFSMHASLKEGNFQSLLQLRDSLANFDLDLKAGLFQRPYNIDANLNLGAVDLQGLGITDHDLRARGILQFSADGDSLTDMRANLEMRDWDFFNEGDRYHLDSLMTQLESSAQKTSFNVGADFAAGHFNSNIPINQIDNKIRNHVNQYYEFGDSLVYSDRKDGKFDFEFQFKSSKLITEAFWPELTGFKPFTMSGSFNEESDHLDINITAPEITYGELLIDSLTFIMLSDKNVLNYALNIEELRSGNFELFNPKLSGSLTNQELNVLLEIVEDNGFKNLILNGDFSKASGQDVRFTFRPDGIVIADKIWSVPAANVLQFGPGGIYADSFELSRNGKLLSLQSTDSLPGAPLAIKFNNFDLRNISQIVHGEEDLIGGILSGNLTLEKPENVFLYRGNAKIDNLSVRNVPLGNLSANAQRANGKIRSEVTLDGDDNNLYLSGYFQPGETGSLDYKLRINRLSMSILNSYAADYIENVSGYLTGSFSVSGETNNLIYRGNLVFNETEFHVPVLGTTYRMNKEELLLSNRGLQFQQVTLLDDENHKATLNGTMETISFTNYRLSLNADIDQFRVLRKLKKEGDLFYGDVLLNSTIKISGTTSRPIVRAAASMVKGADLSLIIPENEAGFETSGGIDEFADVHGNYPEILTYTPADTTTSIIQGIDLRADIRIDKETRMQLFLDDEELNFVSLYGAGDLIFGIDPSGKVTLTGRYEIDRGVYQLVYQKVIRRKFDLEKGSSLMWLGDPLQARLDLRAVHTVETSPLDLIEDQLAGVNVQQQKDVRRSLPFKVKLIMTEELLTPHIRFNLDLTPEYQNVYNGQVYAKLKQLNRPDAESELNKQVFSLLVLGRFLPSDPLAAASGGASATMRNSVTQVLNSQLKKVTDKYSKGFDLDLSIDSYSTAANTGRTEVSLGVSKNLFDERLSVQVGGSVDIEGRQENQKASDLIGDITVEYLITPDGIWRLRGFRKNSFEGIIDGEIIETGVALIFSKNYNHVKELFKKHDDEETPLPASEKENPVNQPLKPEENAD